MQGQRLLSLDFFRGITVVAMIIVNNPGSWDSVYAPLLHAPWNGCTPTDVIFPFFLFIVGVSIHFAYRDKRVEGLTKRHFIKIIKRSALIFILGILLAWFTLPLERMVDWQRLTTLRIPGVLQRISLVFLVCSLIYFKTTWLGQIRIAAFFLVLYYLLMILVPVPDFGPANLEPGTNLAAWSDRLLLDGHLWSQSKTWDPEGVLSTLPAICTGLLGILTGQLFHHTKNPAERVIWLFLAGGILILSGLAWDIAFPINKSLWTSSYVLYTGGLAMQALAGFHWIIDILDRKSWIKPFLYFGVNAIFAFVASGFAAKILLRTKIAVGTEETESLWSYLFYHMYARWMDARFASLLFAVTLVALFYVVLRWMYHRKIFIKV
jgi:predicted acyltransferase